MSFLNTKRLQDEQTRRIGRISLILISLLCLIHQVVNADTLETFEGPRNSWSSVLDADCRFLIRTHSRTSQARRSGQQSEFFNYEVERGGSRVLVTHEIDPTLIIRELSPSLWIKSSQPGLQLMVRVVFPNTRSSSPNGGPISALITGPSYTDTNQWQKLSFDSLEFDMKQLLAEKTRQLRTQLPGAIDDRRAYIDRIVLNLYTQPGLTRLWIDDLEMSGAVDVRNSVDRSNAPPTNSPSTGRGNPQAVRPNFNTHSGSALSNRKGSTIEVRGTPFFAKAIHYHGEPLEFIKELGFNTLVLRHPPNESFLRESLEKNVYLVCPPPASFESVSQSQLYQNVIAWNLGSHLDRDFVESTRQVTVRLRNSPVLWQRPLYGNVEREIRSYSGMLDIVHVGQLPLGTGVDPAQYEVWLQQKSRLAQGGTPLWATIQTEPTLRQLEQNDSMSQRPTRWNIDYSIIRHMAYQSIGAGCRGLVFSSNTRLDSKDTITETRAKSLKWLNYQLDKLAPWAAAGVTNDSGRASVDSLSVSVINIRGSRLIIPSLKSSDLLNLPYETHTPFTVIDGNANQSSSAYHIKETGLIPLTSHHSAGSLRIELDELQLATAIVVTEDPLAIKHLSRTKTARIGADSIELHRELLSARLDQHIALLSRLGNMGKTTSKSFQLAEQAATQKNNARKSLESGHREMASTLLTQSGHYILASERSALEAATLRFHNTTTSPLCLQASTLPQHWDLAEQLRLNRFGRNTLPAGDFENLDVVLRSGWQYFMSEHAEIEASVDLSGQWPADGKRSLHLVAHSKSAETAPEVFESTPVWVSSPKIHVRQGQVVRIHGWVRIPDPIQNSLDGFMIIDSLGGPSFGERLHSTDRWQPFTLYRGVATDQEFKVTFALTGFGEVFLDNVSIEISDGWTAPPAAAQNSPKPRSIR